MFSCLILILISVLTIDHMFKQNSGCAILSHSNVPHFIVKILQIKQKYQCYWIDLKRVFDGINGYLLVNHKALIQARKLIYRVYLKILHILHCLY